MITYCTNIHPAESWDEVLLNLRTHLLRVKKAVSPTDLFPMGLRLSNRASLEIDENAAAWFYEWCQEHDCYVPTINGFPYGSFHSSQIKEKAYLPDWRAEDRIEYTNRLADLLDAWLPDRITGSISTVPIGFKNYVAKEDFSIIRQNLMKVLEHIDGLRQKSGKEIILSLEPEPGCVLETTMNVINFFEQMNFPDDLINSIGICFDCCHQAVQFENPSESLSMLTNAGVRLGKVQVSSAPRIKNPDPGTLERFYEPSYLHQVVIQQKNGTLIRYNDLPDALRDHQGYIDEEWRIHFHVPIFIDKVDIYGTTRYFIEEIISLVDNDILLEVETYTWHVLPEKFQIQTVTESIIREIKWVQSQVNEKNCCP